VGGNSHKHEVRILRYNSCSESEIVEEYFFESIIKKILPLIPNLKVQISAGSEVKAACGQFLVSRFK